MRTIKDDLINKFANYEKAARQLLELSPEEQFRYASIAAQAYNGVSAKEYMEQVVTEQIDYSHAKSSMDKSQMILFSAEQAEIFQNVSKQYQDSLDYMLPFPVTLLWFDRPALVDYEDKDDALVGLVLCQLIETLGETRSIANKLKSVGVPERFLPLPDGDDQERVIRNVLIGIFPAQKRQGEYSITRFSWISNSSNEFINHEYIASDVVKESWKKLKRLAIACIGYINCENVYLHKEGEVDEAINRKRERKGKRRLEPYYVCRIRGVNYESQATGEGDGTKHGHRYDVRGHFRRLDDGRVTWVRPHQRGLANELYIPKVYKVDKE